MFRFAAIALAALPAATSDAQDGTVVIDRPTKHFALTREQIRPLVDDYSGAIVSDRIVVDGRPVGYMYREAPDRPEDSGWRFLAGDEDDAYMDNAGNHGVYAVNTIANFDPEIIPLLKSPPGSAFIRINGRLVPDPQGAPQPPD